MRGSSLKLETPGAVSGCLVVWLLGCLLFITTYYVNNIYNMTWEYSI